MDFHAQVEGEALHSGTAAVHESFTFDPQLYLSHCAELIAGLTSPLQEGQLMNKASGDYF